MNLRHLWLPLRDANSIWLRVAGWQAPLSASFGRWSRVFHTLSTSPPELLSRSVETPRPAETSSGYCPAITLVATKLRAAVQREAPTSLKYPSTRSVSPSAAT